MTPAGRRALLNLDRRAAAMAVAALFGGVLLPRALAPARAATAGGRDPFRLGVASGTPRPDSVVLWTRLAPQPHEPGGGLPDAPIELQWELAADASFTRELRSGTTIAHPEHAHSVHLPVAGLRSDAHWFYRFRVGDAASPVGRTRTAPAVDGNVSRLRIALASCQHYEHGAYTALRDIAQQDVDFVLFVGDYIYESSNPDYRLRPHEGPPPRTLDQYRARHATYKLDADLRAAHAAHPWVLTWDDHEVENDYAGDAGSRRGTRGAFLRRRTAAYRAYFEHLPVSPQIAPQGAAMRIHDRLAWGKLADLWILDARQYRSLQACPANARAGGRLVASCDGLADASRSVLGDAQERWLAEGIASSRALWKLVAQASQLTPWAIDSPFGRRIYTDAWDGYPQARMRLLDALAPAAGSLLCLGGDVHRNVAAGLRQRPDDPGSVMIGAEFVCTSISTRGLGTWSTEWIRASNPDLLHARGDERGYALLDIRPDRATCSFRTTAFPVTFDARLATQAAFEVRRGVPGVLPV